MGGIFSKICSIFFISTLVTGTLSFYTNQNVHAATFVVNNNGDTTTCDSTICTLRGAILSASATPEKDEIIIGPSIAHIKLKTELTITSDATVTGTAVIDAQKNSRVIAVAKNAHVTLAGVYLTGGQVTSSPFKGAGVYNQGTLVLKNVRVFNNVIAAKNATKKILAHGAGVYNASGATLTITKSEIGPRNIVEVEALQAVGAGAGIYNAHSLLVSDSSIYHNYVFARAAAAKGTAGAMGGGVYLTAASVFHLGNSTISGNLVNAQAAAGGTSGTAFANGGAIYASAYSKSYLANTTVAENIVQVPTATYPDGTATGHAFFVVTVPKTIFKLKNSVITSAGDSCIYAVQSDGYNVSSDKSCLTAPKLGDLLGVKLFLSPLGANGGSTPTHALASTSPAVNAGNPAGCTDYAGKLLWQDQRDAARPKVGCDSGAFEL